MGKFVWHEYSRLLSITASVYAVWAAFFGLFYRKFFWDFIGGTVRDPGGLQPSPKVEFLIDIIVKVPAVQIFAIMLGIFMVSFEYPLPIVKDLRIYRNLVFRIVLLIFQAFINALYYQGTNAALYSLAAAGCYARAQMLGERLATVKESRGRKGAA